MNTFLNSDKSIYLQISEIIETDILRGILLEDEKVPSTNELTKQYTINPATAAKGISLLVAEGILYKKGASGCSFLPAPGNRFLKNAENYSKSSISRSCFRKPPASAFPKKK